MPPLWPPPPPPAMALAGVERYGCPVAGGELADGQLAQPRGGRARPPGLDAHVAGVDGALELARGPALHLREGRAVRRGEDPRARGLDGPVGDHARDARDLAEVDRQR